MKRMSLKLKELVQALGEALSALPQMAQLLFRAQPWYVFALIVIQGVQGLTPLLAAWITKELFDLLARAVQQRQTTANTLPFFLVLLAAQAGTFLLSQVLAPPGQYFQVRLNLTLSTMIKTRVYQRIAGFVGLAYFEDPTFHDSIQVATNNAQIGPQQLLSTSITLFESLVTLGSFLGVLLAFQPVMALLILLAVLPQLYAQVHFGSQRFRLILTQTLKERLAAYYGQVLTWIDFAKEVRLFALGPYFLRKYVRTLEETTQAQVRQQQRELHWNILLATLAALVSGGMSVYVALQTFIGRLSLGDMALYLSAVSSLQTTLLGTILALTNMPESVRFFRQYMSLLALPQPLPISPTPQPIAPLHTGIEFRDVSFRYSEQYPWTLRHVDLFLPARQCLALVGLNGAGKTTLVKLLTRLYDPTEGQILWDGTDIREFDPGELRQHLGAIFQDFARYDLSVHENIGLGDVSQIENRLRIEEAARKAGIHEYIEHLPLGYESILSRMLARPEESVDFSGGEWQKLALARMFLRHTDLLVLDEPTAALDAQAEYELYQQFYQLMRDRTCLLITHRFSTVRMADHIAVLEHGRITEYGTHAELLTRQGTYAKLYAMQAESYAEAGLPLQARGI
ncbi:MAG TPA: ABC transporter ATP-binding protein [Ktedonobacterales bacterium]|nr:ABC transporter ATP-binding protein [Ktedonobacterales bacterium]